MLRYALLQIIISTRLRLKLIYDCPLYRYIVFLLQIRRDLVTLTFVFLTLDSGHALRVTSLSLMILTLIRS